jgi:hypothetical protein
MTVPLLSLYHSPVKCRNRDIETLLTQLIAVTTVIFHAWNLFSYLKAWGGGLFLKDEEMVELSK